MDKLRLGRVVLFLVLTLGLTWSIALVVARHTDKNAYINPGLPPLGMLVPAFVALSIELFGAPDSAIYYRKYREKPRLIIWAYLLLTLLMGVSYGFALEGSIRPDVLIGVNNALFVLWTLLLIRLYRTSGPESFRRAGLQLGNSGQGVLFVVGVVIFFLSQAGLNLVFDLGDFQAWQGEVGGIPISKEIYPLALIATFLLTIIGTPLGSLAVTFGEEYGWRGFLQRELSPLGRRFSVLLVGLIWAIWHIPIIQSGIHTYPPTLMGFTFSFVFFITWGFVQSYAVLKTRSIWTAAFLHGVVNGVYAFTITYLVRPEDKLFAFGLGTYGLLFLSVIVLWILRDPVWDNIAPSAEHVVSLEPNS